MDKQAGIWIDSKKAVIVELVDGEKTLKTLASGIESREREPGETKKFGRFAKQFLSFEKRKQRKLINQEKKYFKSVLNGLTNFESIVLFGPSSTKRRLEKELSSNQTLKDKLKGVEDADSMTDNQVAAWVSEYFKR